jgi:hypothetical protein
MAGLMNRVSAFLRSPSGRRAVDQARRQAARPENRAKLQRLLGSVGRRRRPPY